VGDYGIEVYWLPWSEWRIKPFGRRLPMAMSSATTLCVRPAAEAQCSRPDSAPADAPIEAAVAQIRVAVALDALQGALDGFLSGRPVKDGSSSEPVPDNGTNRPVNRAARAASTTFTRP